MAIRDSKARSEKKINIIHFTFKNTHFICHPLSPVWSSCKRRIVVRLQKERTSQSLIKVDSITAHPCTRLNCATRRIRCIPRWTTECKECIILNRLNIELNGTSMRAQSCQTARLPLTSIRPEISVSYRLTNARSWHKQRLSIGMNHFDVVRITRVESSGNIVNSEERTRRI